MIQQTSKEVDKVSAASLPDGRNGPGYAVQGDFVNASHRNLLYKILGSINNSSKLRDHAGLRNAFAQYEIETAKIPAIIPYIENKINPSNPSAGFTKFQFELFMASMLFRSYSTYITIPRTMNYLVEAHHVNKAGYIAKNVSEEIGHGKYDAHINLLFESIAILSNAVKCFYLDEIKFAVAGQILRYREEFKDPQFGNRKGDWGRFNKLIEERDLIIPSDYDFSSFKCREADFNKTVYFCNILPPDINHYHELVLHVTGDKYPHKGKRLLVSLLELATREASSVNPSSNSRKIEGYSASYIGIYDEFIKAYLGYVNSSVVSPLLMRVPPFEATAICSRARTGWQNGENQSGYHYGKRTLLQHVQAWSHAHNDECTGKKRGWGSSAESGHASDAVIVAGMILDRVSSPEIFILALNEVTTLVKARLEFWKSIVNKMEELEGRRDDHNTFIPALRKRPFLSFRLT